MKNPRPINVAFDIDDTIYKVNEKKKRQEPDYEIIAVLKWFARNGDNVYLWSAAGPDYCRMIAEKFGLDKYVKEYIPKPELYRTNETIDLTFDDCEIGLGKTNVLVRRAHNQGKYESMFERADRARLHSEGKKDRDS